MNQPAQESPAARRRRLNAIGMIFGAMIIIALWVFFAPTKLGGSTTYAITDGISMQPLLHNNDLALIRSQPSYHIGDIVLYQNQTIHRPVLHRILMIQDGKYFFKGDNNDFDDPGYAIRNQLTGKLWVHIPKAGSVLGWFGKPLQASIIAALSVMAFVLTSLKRLAHEDRRPKRKASPAQHHNLRRLPLSLVIISIFWLLFLALTVTLVTSFTAGTDVPASNAGGSVNLLQASQLAPVGCSALTLNSVITGPGNLTNNLSNVLILGNGGSSTINDNGTNNCIVSGIGSDTPVGAATDICINGPTLNVVSSCQPSSLIDSFAILAGSGITNTGPTTISGDIGSFPTPSITGLGSMTIAGTNHGGDTVTQGAKTDLMTAYNTAVGKSPTGTAPGDLGGYTFLPGVYNAASSIGLTGSVTLDGNGDPNAIFIFQAGSTFITASASSVNLINGAQSCHVIWAVGSSATLGTGTTLRGTLLALTSITVTTGTTIDGRVLAINGAVTLDTNSITKPTCAS
jgi:signal peptidase I